MGCNCGREKSDQEELILGAQQLLTIAQNPASLYSIFKQYSRGNEIGQADFNKIKDILKISMHPAVFHMLSELKSDENIYPLDVLATLCVFVSISPVSEKANIFFKIFQENQSEDLEKARVRKLFSTILDISTVHLPKLVLEKDEKMKKYLLKLSDYQDKYLDIIMDTITFQGGKLEKKNFCEFLSKEEHAYLTDPSQLRKEITELADKDEIYRTGTSDQNITFT